MTEPLSDAAALAIYDAVWPGDPDTGPRPSLANSVRRMIAEPSLRAATRCPLVVGSGQSVNASTVRELRRLAGIDDDAELVERMAAVIRAASGATEGGPWQPVTESDKGQWRKAARACLAVVRSEEGL